MNILVVDDFRSDREMLAQQFRADHDVRCAADLEETERLLENWWPDVALIDAIFPRKRNGQPVFAFESFLEMLEGKRDANLEMPQVVMISGQNEAAKRFEDVRQWLIFGRVADVIPKSTADVGVEFFRAVVRLRIEALLDRQRWRTIQNSAQATSEWFARLGIITKSQKILGLMSHLIAAAKSPACVLLSGSTGCGKELFAKALHQLAKPGRKLKPINCAAISSELFEAEVFGVKGIRKDHPVYPEKTGLIESAADGTVFLDDIQTMKIEHQAKLLRFLQERRYLKVGATDEVPFLGKVIAATNKDLLEEAGKGNFREDLYYRIAVFKIQIPDLADRPEDIPILTEHFLSEFVRLRRNNGQPCPDIHVNPKSRALLVSATWNGNVRQLKSVIDSAAELALVEFTDSEAGVVINPELLLKCEHFPSRTEPQLAVPDKFLETSGIDVQRWSELNESLTPAIIEAIKARLSPKGKMEFENMEAALRPREYVTDTQTSGREKQDPATIHCLKALLFMLLHPENHATVQDLMPILGLAWAQAKKVLVILAAEEPSTPKYAALVKLPQRGGRQEAQLAREMVKPKDLLDAL